MPVPTHMVTMPYFRFLRRMAWMTVAERIAPIALGHPLGATGVANVCEVVWHLRGEAGGRQVEGAKVGMAHVIGLGSACTLQVLEKV